MLAAKSDPFAIGTLKYWWCGKDAPINSIIYDRVSGFPFELTGGASWNQEGGYYDFTEYQYRAYCANLNSVTLKDGTTGAYSMGNHFRVVFDMDFKPLGQREGYFFDLGSVTSATKAIGFCLSPRNTGKTTGFNWKMLGNKYSPGLLAYDIPPSPQVGTNYTPCTGYFEIVDGGDGYDRAKILNNGQEYVFPAQVPKIFYGNNWQPQYGAIGGSINSSHGYSTIIKLRDLKVYVID